jgi:hypothetical protein
MYVLRQPGLMLYTTLKNTPISYMQYFAYSYVLWCHQKQNYANMSSRHKQRVHWWIYSLVTIKQHHTNCFLLWTHTPSSGHKQHHANNLCPLVTAKISVIASSSGHKRHLSSGHKQHHANNLCLITRNILPLDLSSGHMQHCIEWYKQHHALLIHCLEFTCINTLSCGLSLEMLQKKCIPLWDEVRLECN